MEQTMLHKEEENKHKGMIVSAVVHALLLLICLIPYMQSEEKPEQISGIMVAFGTPDGGSNSDVPQSENDNPIEDTKPENQSSANTSTKSTATKKEEDIAKPKTDTKPVEDIVAAQQESVIAAKEAQKEKAKKEADAAEADRLKTQAEELAQKEAQKKAEEEAQKAAYDKSKSKFSDLLGSGKGNNNNSGNQGSPDGDPNSTNLEQIATGSGRIGGGLSDRGVLFEPEIDDNSQKTGKVVIKVCVDKTGKVFEAKFTQRGSTTTDSYLIDVATKATKQYQFTPSEIEEQCGSITIEFKVK